MRNTLLGSPAASTGVNEITGESRVFTEDPGGSPVLLLQ
jgi:hypothetical protein